MSSSHLFSDLGTTQSPRRCNLSVSTFETLGKIRANLHYHVHTTKVAMGKPTRRRHAHMHTQAQPGINIDVATNLEESFTWVPPLIGQSEDDLAGPETISLDDVDKMFAAFEQDLERSSGTQESFGSQGILDGALYSFDELDRVDAGMVPCALDEVAEVVDHTRRDDDGWDAALLMSSSGLNCT